MWVLVVMMIMRIVETTGKKVRGMRGQRCSGVFLWGLGGSCFLGGKKRKVFGMWGEKKKELAEAAALLLGVSFDFPFVNSSCLLMVLVHVDLWAYILGGES